MLTRLLRSLFIGESVQDELIDTLIKPPQPKYAGHDEALRKRTESKRQRAASIKREAVQLETEAERPRWVRVG